MRNLSDYLHARDLKFGIYTSKGPLTCLGYQPTQPNRPGSCGFEQVDADVYAFEWRVDQVRTRARTHTHARVAVTDLLADLLTD